MRVVPFLLTAAVVCAAAGCGSDDGGDDDDDNNQQPNDSQTPIPNAEQINAALADAGVVFDEGGVTIGDSRIDLGPDGIRFDDASVVSVEDGSVIIGSGDGSIAIRTDGTCAELLECCDGLADEAAKMQCMTAHDSLVLVPFGGGDFLCGQAVAGFCP
jgi:hypothetical protein